MSSPGPRWALRALLLAAPASTAAQTVTAGHVLGDPAAPIEIVEFGDYSCTFCAHFERSTMSLVRRDWIDSGRASFRFVPFHRSYYRQGRNAARAAECAAQQDAYWPMHEVLFGRQDEWLGRRGEPERLRAWAVALGLDGERFDACWEDDTSEELLKRNTELARERGVRGTPAFFINGRPAVGALPYDDFRRLLEEAARGGGR